MKNKTGLNLVGFTLVELVVAIAILGVITLMAIPTVSRIQAHNRQTKYIAYEKSLKAASKAFTDAYDEDLFGATNSGCATIKYSELKERDLVSDLQIKGTKCDKDSKTFIFVIKDKNKNHEYFSNIECYDSKGVVYSHREGGRDSCEIEDGKGPTVSVIFEPEKETYYLGTRPKARIKLSDKGVGLREKQKIKYVWYKNGSAKTSTNTLEFKNKNYQGSVSRYVQMPSDLEDIDEPTDYMLKVFTDSDTGKICDVDLNCVDAKIDKPMHYFVGALQIKMKAGGDSMTDPHGTPYSVKSNDYIVRNDNDYIISKIKYNGSGDLWNYNNPEYINILKTDHYIDQGQEWKTSSKIYDQSTTYHLSDFGYTNDNLIYENKTVEVTANWKPKVRITVRATDQSKYYDGTPLYADNTCSLTSGTLMSGDRINCSCSGSQTTVGSSTKTLASVQVLDSSGNDVSYRYIITPVHGILKISCNNVISGTIAVGQTVYYAGLSWTVTSAYPGGVTLAFNGWVDANATTNGSSAGNYNNSQYVVSVWLNNNDIMRAALAGQCIYNGGSNSYTSLNAPAVEYWQGNSLIYVPRNVYTYSYTSHKYAAGWNHSYGSDATAGGTASGIISTYHTGTESALSIFAGTTAYLNPASAMVTYPSATVISTTSGNLSHHVTAFKPYTGESNASYLYSYRWKKSLSASEWGDPQKIGNTKQYKLHICGGANNDGTYELLANSNTDYKYKLPTDSSYASSNRTIGAGWYYAFAGWQAHVHLDSGVHEKPWIKDYYFTDALCEDQTVDSGDRPDITCSNDHCFTKNIKTISDLAYNVYYRPSITVYR